MRGVLTLACLLLTAACAQVATAAPEGDIKISGSILAWRLPGGDCFVANLDNLKAAIPAEWTPAFSVIGLAFRPLREKTPEELAICSHAAAPTLKRWRVMENGTAQDRPVREIVDGVEVPVSTPRAPIGPTALCSNSDASYHRQLYDNPPRAWRDFVINNKRYITICVFR